MCTTVIVGAIMFTDPHSHSYWCSVEFLVAALVAAAL